MRTKIVATAAAAILCSSMSACSSSAKRASDTTVPVTTTPAPAPSPDGSCPFSGTTDSQREPGGTKAAVLQSVAPTAAGCIDNVTFAFAKDLAPSVTAYQPATTGATGATLVVTFTNATLGGSLKAGTTIDPKRVNYVSKVTVSSANDDVVFAVSLDKMRPFQVSSSQVPAQFVLAIG